MMVKQKFTWFFDMATSADSVQHLKVYAGGNDIFRRLQPFFAAYKHYKLGSVKLKFCAAATLPVDPTGLSYEVGEQTADPRDLFNSGLVRITNGEDVAPITNMNEYYATLLDSRWYKFNMQKGFMRSAVPLYWDIGQIRQDMLPGHASNIPSTQAARVDAIYPVSTHSTTDDAFAAPNAVIDRSSSSSYGLFQTGQKTRMGWLPTDFYEFFEVGIAPQSGGIMEALAHGVNIVPEVPLLDIILPQSHKTKFYYRVYVEETVYFKDAVAINPYPVDDSTEVNYSVPADRFIFGDTKMTSRNVLTGRYAGNSAMSSVTDLQNIGGGMAVTPIDQSYDPGEQDGDGGE